MVINCFVFMLMVMVMVMVMIMMMMVTCTRPVSTAVPPRRRLRVTMMLVKRPKTSTMMCVFPP